MKKNKLTVSFFIILLSFFLVAFDIKIVELLNPDMPIIDLDNAIQLAPNGNQGKDSDSSQEDGKDQGNDNGADNSNLVMRYDVDIEGEVISFRGTKYSRNSLEQIAKDIQNTIISANYRVHINLNDKYAEANTYRDVDKLIKGLKNMYDFDYSAD